MAEAPSIKFQPGNHLITLIDDRVLRPLQRYGRYEEFHPLLVSYLRKGLLQTIRGVEIMLKSNEEHRFDATYSEYCYDVSSLCNSVMQEMDPDWRCKYYQIELDQILVILELAKMQRQPKAAADQVTLFGQKREFNHMQVEIHDSPAFHSPGTTVITPGMSPGSVTLPFTTSSTPLTKTEFLPPYSPGSFPVNDPGESSSKSSPNDPIDALPLGPSLPRTVSFRICEDCGQVIKGAKDSRANLERHKDQVHRPWTWKYDCKVSGCDQRFARSDYLQKHCEKAHNHVRSITRRRQRKPDNSQDL